MRKGALYTLEAVIAVFIVLAFFMIIFSSKEALPEFRASLKIRGFNALKSLDESNELRKYVLADNTEEIEKALHELLPPGIDYKVSICNDVCVEPKIEGERIVVSYLLAGDFGKVEAREVKLYMVIS